MSGPLVVLHSLYDFTSLSLQINPQIHQFYFHVTMLEIALDLFYSNCPLSTSSARIYLSPLLRKHYLLC